MNENFAKWVVSPEVAALALTQREMLVAQLAWANATIAANEQAMATMSNVLQRAA